MHKYPSAELSDLLNVSHVLFFFPLKLTLYSVLELEFQMTNNN